MKTLTLYQPWASLIAYGVKTIETRSWGPPRWLVGQRVAIHAGKRVVAPQSLNPETRRAIADCYGEQWLEEIPKGAVVATAVLANALKVKASDGRQVTLWGASATGPVDADPYGDFGPGRWLWFLQDVFPYSSPIPAVGRMGLWDWYP